MQIRALFSQAAAYGLSATLVLTAQFGTMAKAEIYSTDIAIAKYGQSAEREYLMSQLQTEAIRNQLIELGVDPAEAESRLAALSGQEIRSMLSQFEIENAGGEAILSTLLTLFVILLVTDFLCLTRIFKFTRCI